MDNIRANNRTYQQPKKREKSVWSFFGGDSPERDSIRDSVGPRTDELQFIKGLINAYFNIVKRNLIDYIPKTIITLLVNESCDICDKELVTRLYKEDKISELLTKDDNLVKKQSEIEYDLNMLHKCRGILDEFERASVR